MSQPTQSIRFEKFIKVSPGLVYEAFTNATSLREWMCDIATAHPKPGGRIYWAWNSGFYAMGEFIKVQPNEYISFTWFGRNEPASSQVEIHLTEQPGGTGLQLEHHPPGTGQDWGDRRFGIQTGWEAGLENLISVLETGEDQRFTRRPMLGIGIGEFNQVIAQKIGVPVSEGLLLDTTVEGMGAHTAGLRSNDVIFRMDGKDIFDWAGLQTMLQPHRAGDKIQVEFYRGNQKMSVSMELSKRPLPSLPASILELTQFARKRQEEIHSELDEFFKQVTDAEASYKSAPDEWSVKEVLAHLIHGERFSLTWIVELIGRQEAQHDDWAGNMMADVQATVAVHPTLMELRQAYKRATEEVVVLLSNLPPEFPQHKASFWRLAYSTVDDPFHHRIHLDQMRAAVEAARNR